MRKAYFLFLIFLFSLFTFSPISIKAISVNSQEFWFYVSEPTLIDYPQMSFQVKNTKDTPITVNCSFEAVSGVDVEIFLEWETSILDGGEVKFNHYSIYANITYAATVRLEIDVVDVTGGNLGAAVRVANYIVFYSGEEGYLLDVNIVDQSGVPRMSEIIVNHKTLTNLTWTPIEYINASSFTGYYPVGHYFIQAKDLETNIYSESIFYLDNTTNVIITLHLVGFNRFKFMQDVEDPEIIGVNTTIFNNLQVLHDIEIFAEIYRDGELVKSTPKVAYENFPHTIDWDLEMWFPRFSWESGNYSIIGKMVSHEILIAFKHIRFRYAKPPTELDIGSVIVAGLIAVGVVMIIKFQYDKKQYFKQLKKLEGIKAE